MWYEEWWFWLAVIGLILFVVSLVFYFVYWNATPSWLWILLALSSTFMGLSVIAYFIRDYERRIVDEIVSVTGTPAQREAVARYYQAAGYPPAP